MTLDLGGGRERDEHASLLADAREGFRAAARMRAVRALVAGGAAVVLFAGLFNVGELLLAKDELGAGEAGFGLLVAIFGLGVIGGSLTGSSAEPSNMKRRYLTGMAVTGSGFLLAAVSPGIVLAAAGFLVGGIGNGLVVVHQRLMLQTTVGDRLLGRVFGFKETMNAWAYVIAFLFAGVLMGLAGTRGVLAASGLGVLTVAAASAWSLRGAWDRAAPIPVGEPLPGLVERLDGAERPVPATVAS
jgi:MFS family permease